MSRVEFRHPIDQLVKIPAPKEVGDFLSLVEKNGGWHQDPTAPKVGRKFYSAEIGPVFLSHEIAPEARNPYSECLSIYTTLQDNTYIELTFQEFENGWVVMYGVVPQQEEPRWAYQQDALIAARLMYTKLQELI